MPWCVTAELLLFTVAKFVGPDPYFTAYFKMYELRISRRLSYPLSRRLALTPVSVGLRYNCHFRRYGRFTGTKPGYKFFIRPQIVFVTRPTCFTYTRKRIIFETAAKMSRRPSRMKWSNTYPTNIHNTVGLDCFKVFFLSIYFYFICLPYGEFNVSYFKKM